MTSQCSPSATGTLHLATERELPGDSLITTSFTAIWYLLSVFCMWNIQMFKCTDIFCVVISLFPPHLHGNFARSNHDDFERNWQVYSTNEKVLFCRGSLWWERARRQNEKHSRSIFIRSWSWLKHGFSLKSLKKTLVHQQLPTKVLYCSYGYCLNGLHSQLFIYFTSALNVAQAVNKTLTFLSFWCLSMIAVAYFGRQWSWESQDWTKNDCVLDCKNKTTRWQEL